MSRAKRGSIRRSFTLAYNDLIEEINKHEVAEINTLKRLLKRLEDRFSQLKDIDEVIIQEMSEASQAEIDEEYNLAQEYRDRINDITCDVNNLCKQESVLEISNASVSGQANASIIGENSSRYKLPKLQLTKFDGSPENWLNFWSQFKGIHDDVNLSKEEKFQYLIQATEEKSQARRVVLSFPPTSENYPKAVEYLKTRFGKEDILVEVYVRDILKLVMDTNSNRPLSVLYDLLETKLRALESLGVTSDKYAAMLYPLVESSLSDEILKAWERIQIQQPEGGNAEDNQLNRLMKFLQNEVNSEIRLKMAKRRIIAEDDDTDSSQGKHPKISFEQTTATDLLNKTNITDSQCVFCERNHKSQNCYTAQRMKMQEKELKIRQAKRCFRCLKGNHFVKECRAIIKCQFCGDKHYMLMCKKNQKQKTIVSTGTSHSFGDTILQTLLITVEGPKIKRYLRALVDSGSQRSYITRRAVQLLGLNSSETIQIAHSLFGGYITDHKKHIVHKVQVSKNNYKLRLNLLDEEKICGFISRIPNGPWIEELRTRGIELSDYDQKQQEIDILIGADVASILYTGRIYRTKSGPVAYETTLGWTLMGNYSNDETQTESTTLLNSLHISDMKIQDLWNLDIIGIHDPLQEKSKHELTKSALKHFKENVKILDNGRYEVALPWIEGHQTVAINREIAERRLRSSIYKLKQFNKLQDYQNIFNEWMNMGIIEKVTETKDNNNGDISYLPHHPVYNEKSATTPIRPVFDASSKSKGSPSLNNCLEKGPNLLQLIPEVLIRFRMKRYGITADIKKAFLQISIKEDDRDYLRFLWWEDNKEVVYRHCRVVFGVASSPFLLAATLNHHLDNVRIAYTETATKLKSSLYVDNCVISVDTEAEKQKFIQESIDICAEAKFELRGWIWNRGKVFVEDVPGVGSPECGLGTGNKTFQETSQKVSVLGLLWNVEADTLTIDLRKFLNNEQNKTITKRNILAATHQIFDPIGFTAPVIIIPKILLQDLCKTKIGWDEPVPADIAKKFMLWRDSITSLSNIEIPRWMMESNDGIKTLHIFTDASKRAYTSVAFLRNETSNNVTVQLVMAKSRVSTIKPISMPRLELIGCECGAKMLNYIQGTTDMANIKIYLWSDSGNALSWIKRKENWLVFVYNRVKTIKNLTNADDWHHIPGHLNPADLPSRGCSIQRLEQSRWWEGPQWLKMGQQHWPKSQITCDENIVMAEKKRTVVSHSVQELDSTRYFRKFSHLRKVIRMIGWMRRWKNYKRNKQSTKDLTMEEKRN